jgi:hypothetical protein
MISEELGKIELFRIEGRNSVQPVMLRLISDCACRSAQVVVLAGFFDKNNNVQGQWRNWPSWVSLFGPDGKWAESTLV